jgi:hypothetical protein
MSDKYSVEQTEALEDNTIELSQSILKREWDRFREGEMGCQMLTWGVALALFISLAYEIIYYA